MGSAARMIRRCAMMLTAVPTAATAQTSLTADRTEFVLATADGRMLRNRDLVGASLRMSTPGAKLEITIADVREDERSVGRVLLHHLVFLHSDGSSRGLCAPVADGRSLRFPVPDGKGAFGPTCTSGAVGKCIRFGYRPWEASPGGPPLKALHQACIHMARDYGGDNYASTRDGTLIDIYGRWNIQTSDKPPGLTFEVAWGADEAACVVYTRIPDISAWHDDIEPSSRHPR